MKVIAISDIHGNLPKLPSGDLLLISGDICPVHSHDLVTQYRFLDGPFRLWLQGLDFKKIIAVAGNHDFLFERGAHLIPEDLNWEYLEDSGTGYQGLKIWGSPWQLPFFDWAFNLPESELEKKFSLIPADTDILVTHSPPYGILDRASRGENTGSKSLLKKIQEIRPKLTVFGHIHEAYGTHTRRGDKGEVMRFANASYVDLEYRPVNSPLSFEL